MTIKNRKSIEGSSLFGKITLSILLELSLSFWLEEYL